MLEARCTLLRVVAPGRAPDGPSGGNLREAEDYLGGIAGKVCEQQLPVQV